MLPSGAIIELKIHQNAFTAPLGSLQCSPDPKLVFRGALCSRVGREGKGMGGKGSKRRKGKGRDGEGSV